jgi:hypothetical protein
MRDKTTSKGIKDVAKWTQNGFEHFWSFQNIKKIKGTITMVSTCPYMKT